MTDHWLYSESLPAQPAEWRVVGAEAQHARVKRLAAREVVHLFDGRGTVAQAEVIDAGKQALLVRITSLERVPLTEPEVTVAVSQPKGERLDWMLEKLTELAVARIIPLECQRSVAHVKGERAERWQRRLVEAGKQAHLAWLPRIDGPTDLASLLGRAGEFTQVFVADTAGGAVPILTAAQEAGQAGRPMVLIGPEGGFADSEREMMRTAGIRAVSLGATVLRTETAAIVAAALLRNAGQFGDR